MFPGLYVQQECVGLIFVFFFCLFLEKLRLRRETAKDIQKKKLHQIQISFFRRKIVHYAKFSVRLCGLLLRTAVTEIQVDQYRKKKSQITKHENPFLQFQISTFPLLPHNQSRCTLKTAVNNSKVRFFSSFFSFYIFFIIKTI